MIMEEFYRMEQLYMKSKELIKKLFSNKNVNIVMGVVALSALVVAMCFIFSQGKDSGANSYPSAITTGIAAEITDEVTSTEKFTEEETETEAETTIEETTRENPTTEAQITETSTTVPLPAQPATIPDGDYSYIQPVTPTDGIVTMAFVGDINLSEKIENYYNTSGLSGFLSVNLQNIFLNSSIFGINHEYVSSDAGDEHKVDYELWYYKNPTSRQYILNEMGVDVVTLANNHTLDYGEEGLIDTMNSLKARGIAYVGVGNNLNEAKGAYIKEVNGKKIAILAANRVVPRVDWYAYENKPGQMTTYESTDRFGMIKEEITRLKTVENCDVVVVMVHFGENNVPEVQGYQYNVAHGYVDAGADIIVGCHTHTLQGAEIYNGKYIFYGVSNFLFENYQVDSVVVQAALNEANELTVKLVPCISKNYQTWDVSGNEAKRIFREIEALSTNISISDEGVVGIRN